MVPFPYTKSYEKIPILLANIANYAIPKKFTYRFLVKIGFPSSSDRSLVIFLRDLGLITAKGTPKEAYYYIRDLEQQKASLGAILMRIYVPIFAIDPNAATQSVEVLMGYFSRLLKEDSSNLKEQAHVFKILCEFAQLGTVRSDSLPSGQLEKASLSAPAVIRELPREEEKTQIGTRRHKVNLSINLPTTTDERVYESLFKHLKDLLSDQ